MTTKESQQKTIEFIMGSKTNPVLNDLNILKIITFDTIKNGKQYPALMVFVGNSSKPSKHFYYHSVDERNKSIEESIKMSNDRQSYKVKRKEERKSFVHTLKVDDILVSSWGYDQTNVDFYQVIEVKNKRVVIREIGGSMSYKDGYSSMSGFISPTPNEFVGEPIEKLVSGGNTVKLSSFQYANVWSGSPMYVSWYA